MRATPPALSLLVLFLGSATTPAADVVYRETFSEGKTLEDVGWHILVDAGARIASMGSAVNGSGGDTRGLPPINAGDIAATNHKRGMIYLKEGADLAPFLLYTSEHQPIVQPLVAINWCMALRHVDARMHVAVQVDANDNRKADAADPWFVARDGIADPSADGEGLREISLDLGTVVWVQLDVKAGGRRGSGQLPSSLVEAKPVAALPPGAVVSVGLWSPARYARPHVDTFEVLAAGVLQRSDQ